MWHQILLGKVSFWDITQDIVGKVGFWDKTPDIANEGKFLRYETRYCQGKQVLNIGHIYIAKERKFLKHDTRHGHR